MGVMVKELIKIGTISIEEASQGFSWMKEGARRQMYAPGMGSAKKPLTKSVSPTAEFIGPC